MIDRTIGIPCVVETTEIGFEGLHVATRNVEWMLIVDVDDPGYEIWVDPSCVIFEL